MSYLLLVLAGIYLSDGLLFVRFSPTYHDGGDLFKLTTADGKKITACFLPNPAATFTVLYSHGNGCDLVQNKTFMHTLHDMGFAVCCYDYHGFGTSEGAPSEQAVYYDVMAAYDYLTQHRHIPPQRIIAYGMSLGGGPTAYLAAHRPVAGVILHSTFTTAFRVVTQIPLLPFDKFYSIDNIRRAHCPVLVMHGTDDHTIPFSHGLALYRAAPGIKRCLWVAHADHCNVPDLAGNRYPRAIKEFTRLLDK